MSIGFSKCVFVKHLLNSLLHLYFFLTFLKNFFVSFCGKIFCVIALLKLYVAHCVLFSKIKCFSTKKKLHSTCSVDGGHIYYKFHKNKFHNFLLKENYSYLIIQCLKMQNRKSSVVEGQKNVCLSKNVSPTEYFTIKLDSFSSYYKYVNHKTFCILFVARFLPFYTA